MDVSGHEPEEKSGIKFGADTQKTAPLKKTLFLGVVKKRRVYSEWEIFQYLGLLEHLKRWQATGKQSNALYLDTTLLLFHLLSFLYSGTSL